MDGNTMKYEFHAIEGMAGDIGKQVNRIEGILGDLSNQINNLTSLWDGSANEGFQQVKGKWFTSAEDLNQVLKQIQIAVSTTNTDAQNTEKKNASRWNS